MNSSSVEVPQAMAGGIQITNDALTVQLNDGRSITVPLTWYPRLLNGSSKERSKFRLIGGGTGIHWPELDEDISVENLLFGRPSMESESSLKKWLAGRSNKQTPKTNHSISKKFKNGK